MQKVIRVALVDQKASLGTLYARRARNCSMATLIDDLLAAYESLGGDKFLKSWAAHSHRNLAKFIEILFKFGLPSQGVDPSGNVTYQASEKFMPKIERIYTDKRPGELKDDKNKRIKKLENLLRKQDAELRRLRAIVDIPDGEVIEHEPIRPKELPEHDDETEIEEKIEVLEKRKRDLEQKLEERGK